jgi:osmotically-inducible protein OsmY
VSFVFIVALSALACRKESSAAEKPPENYPANNTGRNERDSGGAKPTPLDQGENKSDLAITQKIRQAVVGDPGLSMLAENIKIVTVDANVTLRGVVNSQTEKESIEAKAKGVAGVRSVDNQLDVKSK